MEYPFFKIVRFGILNLVIVIYLSFGFWLLFFEIKNKNFRIKIQKSNLRCRFGVGADAADQHGLAADGVGQLPGERSFL